MTAVAYAPQSPASGTGSATSFVRWLADTSRADVAIVGGKGANLGEMARAGLPVPDGFVVTVDAHRAFVDANDLARQVRSAVTTLVLDDPAQLSAAAEAIQARMRNAPLPDDVQEAVLRAYDDLVRREPKARGFVSVRSSATVEDSAQYSFAGMFESYLNVHGHEELLRRIRDCWASSFGARVLYYRRKQGLPAELQLGVVVQRMIASEKSGVMFTVNPATRDPSRLVIEAAFGLGEAVVGGQVTPDHYEVDKASLAITARRIAHKSFALVRDPTSGATVRQELDDARADATTLTDAELQAIARLGVTDERHYGVPQDVEFAIEGDAIHIVQTRPVTVTLEHGTKAPDAARTRVLLHGLAASPGVASGTVRVLLSPADAGRIQDGEVLVTTVTSPDWVPIMRRAAAIVTDEGGMTSHAAIVSRELGIPCIVGTREATRVLRDGVVVTVDAREGVVMEGKVATTAPSLAIAAPDVVHTESTTVTATRLYVNLAEPSLAEAVAARPVDGVGLLRAEFLMLDALERTHPRLFLHQGRGEEFVTRMADGLRAFARAFHPRPVVYRAMDFRSNEFRGLNGGADFEPKEENPMIGYRGCFRYTREPELFALELRAVARVREQFPNLHLMIPFVRTGSEFRACKALIDASPLGHDRTMQLWVMAEVPSVVTWLPEYVRMGVTGVSIGSNDLTQLMLGVDRDSAALSSIYDERDPAVLAMVRAIIVECRRLGITCSICGQAPSVYPEYVRHLVTWGIDSVSVNPDVIDVTRRNLAAAERELLVEAARDHLEASARQQAEAGHIRPGEMPGPARPG